MNQIVHIFRKDTRHCWPEILLSLAITAALVCIYPLRWLSLPGTDALGTPSMNAAGLGTMLAGLVVVSWVMLIARIVHAESLVGVRQFWLTRPYEWKKLLAAKLIFLAVYLYLPLMVAQWLLLYLAGLNSVSTIPGLLFNLLLITGFVVLPLVAIATVTENFFRMASALLGALLMGVAALVSITLQNYSYGYNNIWYKLLLLAMDNLAAPAHSLTSIGHHKQLLFALLFATVSGTVVLLQYARRKTWLCRMILLALPIAIAIGGMVQAHYAIGGQAQIDHDYPKLSADASPIQLAYGVDEKHPIVVFRGRNSSGALIAGARIPLHVSEIAEGTALSIDHRIVTIEAPDGFRWSTEARFNSIGQYDLPGNRVPDDVEREQATFEIPYALYERIKTGPVTVRITLALTQLQATNSVRATLPTHDVAVPGFGLCEVEIKGYGTLQCRRALRGPQLTNVRVGWSKTPCAVPEDEHLLNHGLQWLGQLDREPAEFGIVPIQFLEVTYGWAYQDPKFYMEHVCTGAPITFTQYKYKGRSQVNLTIPNFYFPPENPASNIDHFGGRTH
jgi:hypothetical protein